MGIKIMQHLLEDFLPDRFGHYGSRKKVQFFNQGSNNSTKEKNLDLIETNEPGAYLSNI